MLALIALVGICIAYTESINTDDDLALDDDFAIDSLFVTSAPHPLPKPDKFSHGRDDTDREEGEEKEDTEDTEDTDTDTDTDSEWPEECNDLYIRFQEVYYDIYGYVVNGISPTCDEQWSLVNSYRDLYECSGGDFESHIAETFCAETDDGAPDWLETSCICDYTSTSTSTSGCRYDITGDEIANILDIVLLVNTILEESYVVSHDFDGSGGLDILDIVMLVTAIVEGEECAY